MTASTSPRAGGPRPPDVRLIVITDARLAGPRGVDAVVEAALEAGAPMIQLRDKTSGAGELTEHARRLVRLTRRHGARLVVNDRVDVALAAGADGVHLGPLDLPVRSVRGLVPDEFLIGYSTDDPTIARVAESEGADYLGCGAVFGTTTKDVGDEAIGLQRLDEVARSVTIPVVGIGGVDVQRAREVATTAASGTAVVSAVMAASDTAAAVRELLAPFGAGRRPPGGGVAGQG